MSCFSRNEVERAHTASLDLDFVACDRIRAGAQTVYDDGLAVFSSCGERVLLLDKFFGIDENRGRLSNLFSAEAFHRLVAVVKNLAVLVEQDGAEDVFFAAIRFGCCEGDITLHKRAVFSENGIVFTVKRSCAVSAEKLDAHLVSVCDLVGVVADEKLGAYRFAREISLSVRADIDHQRGQRVFIGEEGGFGIAFAVHNGLHPTRRPSINEEMKCEGDHIGIAAEGFGLYLRAECLMLVAFRYPIFEIILGIVVEIVHIAALCVLDPAGCPRFFFLGGSGEPFLRIARFHQRYGVKALSAEFAAAVIPIFLDTEPIAAVESAHIDAVSVVPRAVNVIIGEGVIRRIVVAVDVLDHAIGVEESDCRIASGKECFHFASHEMSVGAVAAVCHRLVHIRDEDAGGMRTNELLHFFGLAHAFCEFRSSHHGEERKVGLKHQTDAVAKIVDLLLYGALCETKEIHIASLCHQHIVKEHIVVAAQYVLLFKAHRVCAAQTDGFAVEIEHTLFLGGHILGEASHTEGGCGCILQFAVCKEGYLCFVEIGRIGCPRADIFHREAELDQVGAFMEVQLYDVFLLFFVRKVGKRDHIASVGVRKRNGLVGIIFDHGFLKVFAVYGIDQLHVFQGLIITVVDLAPDLKFFRFEHRTHEKIGNEGAASRFYTHTFTNTKAGRTVMPARFAVIVAKARGGVHLVAFQTNGLGGRALVAAVYVIVAHGHDERVFAVADIRRRIQFEDAEKALVRAGEATVYKNLRNIVHTVKMQKDGLVGGGLFYREDRSVITNGIACRSEIIGNGDILPFACARKHA